MKQVLQPHHRCKKNGSKRLLPRIGFVSIPYHPSFILRCSFFLTSSLRHPKILIKEFSYFLMPCHQHGLRINLLV